MMKLTKKIEAEILKVYYAYWDAYLKGDMKYFASFLDENVTVYGTAAGEVFANKRDAVKFYKATTDQMTGKADFRKRRINLKASGNTVVINEESDLYVLIDGVWTFYDHARITAIIEQKGNTWKCVHQHGSFPDARTEEGNQIATEEIKKENLQLKDAIKRRTIELENKNRELEIETALEKVRAVAMGMKKADDMLSICKTISQQLTQLGVKEIRNVQTAIFYESRSTYMNYEYYAKHNKTFITEVDFKNHKIQLAFAKKMLKGPNEEVLEQMKGKKLQDWYTYQKSTNQFADKYLLKAHSLDYYWYSLGPVALGISTYYPLTNDETNLFKRFLKVFGLAYRRYLDIEKATAQAREAQIEVALERVRAASMAMRDSSVLSEIINKVYIELTKLDAQLDRCFIMIVNPKNKGITWWMAGHEGLLAENGFFIPMNQHASHLWYLNCWKSRKKKWQYLLEGKEKKEWDRFGFSKTDLARLPEPVKKFMAAQKKVHLSGSSDQFGSLVTGSFEPLPEEQQSIIRRFSIAFNQVYIRFLDLQKAEAQAREAKIEAALEKVRSVAMSMHHSNELLSICESIYVELLKLNITELRNTMINIHNDADETFLNYDYSAYAGKAVTKYGYHIHPIISQLVMQCRSTHDAFLDIALAGEEFETWRSFRKSSGEKDDKRLNSINHLHYYFYSIGIGSIGISTFESIDNEKLSLLKRFRNVFQLAYQRFTDLLAAETQAREAQIESSLERIRSKTMAMHNSDDVGETVAALFDELVKLGVHTNRCGILICGESKTHVEVWTAKSNPDGNATLITGQLELNMHPLIEGFYRSWKKKKEVFTYNLKGDDIVSYYKAINNSKYYPTKFNLAKLPEQEVHTDFYFADGAIFAFSPTLINEEATSIFKRFANVFGQTYRRYIDLKKAESSARESQIEAALERVRGKAMAMHSSEDLATTVDAFFIELKSLQVMPRRCGVTLIDEESRSADLTVTTATQDGESKKVIAKLKLSGHPVLDAVFDNWKLQQEFHPVLKGDEIKEYYKVMNPQVAFPDFAEDEKQYGHYFFFKDGGVFAWTDTKLAEDELKIFRRFTTVLSLTYKRYRDLQQAEELAKQAELDLIKLREEKQKTEDALTELKTTQKQLIQSEKMASLGELTAGIAHEIQNPLNFVNNFSEVSNELIEEMNAELEKGDIEEAKLIAKDVKQNLEKINHHGKRADAIVKGMLQHSRSSSNVKEPTNINALADEYLRLAYHGLRAKDKSFNATMVTDFDESIGNINVISQDIGRVILNLITNAFYVVDEKKKQNPIGYEPTVTVSTKAMALLSGGRGVMIKVSDNGNGIPQKILDKIFQPFFTTKPTGQGTGLGLSLSYDIVKTHGGELKVETKVGEGTEFIIELPV